LSKESSVARIEPVGKSKTSYGLAVGKITLGPGTVACLRKMKARSGDGVMLTGWFLINHLILRKENGSSPYKDGCVGCTVATLR
jgi:hypothetical protein